MTYKIVLVVCQHDCLTHRGSSSALGASLILLGQSLTYIVEVAQDLMKFTASLRVECGTGVFLEGFLPCSRAKSHSSVLSKNLRRGATIEMRFSAKPLPAECKHQLLPNAMWHISRLVPDTNQTPVKSLNKKGGKLLAMCTSKSIAPDASARSYFCSTPWSSGAFAQPPGRTLLLLFRGRSRIQWHFIPHQFFCAEVDSFALWVHIGSKSGLG